MNNNYIGLTLKGFQGEQIEVVSFLEKFNKYQCRATNKNNIVTTPLYDESDIINLINKQSKIIESDNTMKQLQQQEEQEQKEIEQSESIGNFKINDPKQYERAKQTLNKTIKYNGQYLTRKEYVHSILNKNYVPYQIKNKYYFKNLDTNVITEATKTEIEYYNYLKVISKAG